MPIITRLSKFSLGTGSNRYFHPAVTYAPRHNGPLTLIGCYTLLTHDRCGKEMDEEAMVVGFCRRWLQTTPPPKFEEDTPSLCSQCFFSFSLCRGVSVYVPPPCELRLTISHPLGEHLVFLILQYLGTKALLYANFPHPSIKMHSYPPPTKIEVCI